MHKPAVHIRAWSTSQKSSFFYRLLLRYPVDINHENRNKMRALHLAAKIGNYESVKLLIGKNAVINCRNNNYRTPMMMACLFTHADDQKGLIQV